MQLKFPILHCHNAFNYTEDPQYNVGFGGQLQYLHYKLPTLKVKLTFIQFLNP
jgi:hypothetical protein